MLKREDYELLFEDYPDVLTVQELRKMMGGVGESTARHLLQTGHIEHFVIRCTYYIPKICAIDYLMSLHYRRYSKTLKHQIDTTPLKQKRAERSKKLNG
ncbi:MAG: DNA-binding protein [Clostridia bacterium]|jgi:hypothetical protein|nr:DNA-binding protein [Clostridia bacterium]